MPERSIHKEVLHRVESTNSFDRGNKILEAVITYRKDGTSQRPRGYYLTISTFLQGDTGFQQHCLSFGDEGDQYHTYLLEPVKAFNEKKFQAVTVADTILKGYLDQARATYLRREAARKLRYPQAS